MGEGELPDSGGRTLQKQCPFCGSESFSKKDSPDLAGWLSFACADCRLGFRIWRDELSPTESAILADWGAQVPMD